MGRLLRSLALLATLSLWLSSASAFCISDIAYEYVMRGDDSVPEQSLPCCTASSGVAAAVQKDGPAGDRSPQAANDTGPAFGLAPSTTPFLASPPLRWRAYCERSSRLLR